MQSRTECRVFYLCRYDEVIVGAPMYSDIDLAKIEKGRVYVFMNEQVGGGGGGC